jgi:hypothetical protein
MATGDASAAAADAGSVSARDGSPNPNPCPASVSGYRLSGLAVSDFCDAYEKYCKYDATGATQAMCGAKAAGPLFKDRTDCEAQYNMASALGQSCRAGQLCENAPRGLLVNACAHASGYCDPACGQ